MNLRRGTGFHATSCQILSPVCDTVKLQVNRAEYSFYMNNCTYQLFCKKVPEIQRFNQVYNLYSYYYEFNQEYYWDGGWVGGGVSGPSTFIGKICTHFLFKFTKVQINMQTYCPLNVLSGPSSLKVKKKPNNQNRRYYVLTSYHLLTQLCIIGQPTHVLK